MAKAIYVTSSVCLYFCSFVCLWVCLTPFFIAIILCYSTITKSTLNIFCMAGYCSRRHLSMKKLEVKGQWSSLQWPPSPNHKNQFFSKTKNIVFLKFWEMVVLIGVHNRLHFERNRSRHSGSRSRKVLTLKMTINNKLSYHVV